MLAPGGRLGLTVWGHVKTASGAWALTPFRWAAEEKVDNQAAMQMGRRGAGEELLAQHGFVDVKRVAVDFAWEFADPDGFARALASTGPAYESILNVGEPEFLSAAADLARERLRDGLPLRASLPVVGFLARTPT